jgi:hypothetical protein
MSDATIEELEEEARKILFERLRECEQLSVFGEHIETQIQHLEYLVETYHSVARLGGIGYRAFHVAYNTAQTLDRVIGRMRQMQQLGDPLFSITSRDCR